MSPPASSVHTPEGPPGRARRFGSIARYYHELHESLRSSGSEPYRITSLGAWATSRARHVYYFFDSLNLEQYRLLMDLGSGDGIVACIAGLFTRSIGIEADALLCAAAAEASRELNLTRSTRFICADYRTQNIRKADCLYLYPDKPFYELESLLSGWNGSLIVYGPHFPPHHLAYVKQLRCGSEQVVVYRSPSGHRDIESQ